MTPSFTTGVGQARQPLCCGLIVPLAWDPRGGIPDCLLFHEPFFDKIQNHRGLVPGTGRVLGGDNRAVHHSTIHALSPHQKVSALGAGKGLARTQYLLPALPGLSNQTREFPSAGAGRQGFCLVPFATHLPPIWSQRRPDSFRFRQHGLVPSPAPALQGRGRTGPAESSLSWTLPWSSAGQSLCWKFGRLAGDRRFRLLRSWASSSV